MKSTTCIAAALGAGAILMSTSAFAATTWVCNVFAGPKHYVNKGLKAWGRDVGKVTKGQVKVRFLPSSAAPPPKQIDGIVGGTFDCAFIFHAFTARRAVGGAYGILPFISAGNSTHASVAFWRTWEKHFAAKKEFEKIGVKVLSVFQFPGVHMFTSEDKPINSIADLKGMKIWALAGTSSRTMKTAGVNHVSGPAARVAEFTQTKVVQGLVGANRGTIVNYAGVQFAKFGTITTRSIMMPSFTWMVDLRKWNALSPELQKAIMSVSGEKIARKVGLDGDAFEEVSRKKLAKVGVKEIKADAKFEAALEAAGQPQIQGWLKRAKAIGVDGDAVLADYAKTIAELQAKK
jgi:TRAP-type C4-dicarboxylate transport system substrate-binding protein